MKQIAMFIGLVCSMSIIVSCTTTNEQAELSSEKTFPPSPQGSPCWDGSIVFDFEDCPKPPEPAPSTPNEPDTCWDGSIRSNENLCIDRPIDPRTGKPAP